MFNSAEAYAEGRKDGWHRRPKNIGNYGAFELIRYLDGHGAGLRARAVHETMRSEKDLAVD